MYGRMACSDDDIDDGFVSHDYNITRAKIHTDMAQIFYCMDHETHTNPTTHFDNVLLHSLSTLR